MPPRRISWRAQAPRAHRQPGDHRPRVPGMGRRADPGAGAAGLQPSGAGGRPRPGAARAAPTTGSPSPATRTSSWLGWRPCCAAGGPASCPPTTKLIEVGELRIRRDRFDAYAGGRAAGALPQGVRAAHPAGRRRGPGARARGDLPARLGLHDGARRPLGRRVRAQAAPEAGGRLPGLAVRPHPFRRRLPVRRRAGRRRGGRRRGGRGHARRGHAPQGHDPEGHAPQGHAGRGRAGHRGARPGRPEPADESAARDRRTLSV